MGDTRLNGRPLYGVPTCFSLGKGLPMPGFAGLDGGQRVGRLRYARTLRHDARKAIVSFMITPPDEGAASQHRPPSQATVAFWGAPL
jgi:hypothetical protein